MLKGVFQSCSQRHRRISKIGTKLFQLRIKHFLKAIQNGLENSLLVFKIIVEGAQANISFFGNVLYRDFFLAASIGNSSSSFNQGGTGALLFAFDA